MSGNEVYFYLHDLSSDVPNATVPSGKPAYESGPDKVSDFLGPRVGS